MWEEQMWEDQMWAELQFALPFWKWSLLVVVLALASWQYFNLDIFRPLRIVLTILLALAAGNMSLLRESSELHLWILRDVSLSMSHEGDKSAREAEAVIEAERQGLDRPGFKLRSHKILFAAEAIKQSDASLTFDERARNESRIGNAIHYALGQMDQNSANRILLLTDGYSTEGYEGVSSALQENDVLLDYRIFQHSPQQDFAASSLTSASIINLGEAALLKLKVRGIPEKKAQIRVFRNNNSSEELIYKDTYKFRGNDGEIHLRDNLEEPGIYQYRAEIIGNDDQISANNQAITSVRVSNRSAVLLVSREGNPALEKALKAGGFNVRSSSDIASLGLIDLALVDTVIIDNTPALSLRKEFLQGLHFFVTEQGGGLLMTGGRSSFASGGYFDTAVEELLPVTLEERQDLQRPPVNMVIALDRSGSMSAAVDGELTKMDMADHGAMRAVELLRSSDHIAVYAVDTEARPVIPSQEIGGDRGKIIGKISQIQSEGGGIYIAKALKAAASAFSADTKGRKHIILFADAADSEEPGNYKEIIEEMRKNEITLSVIALGTEADSDSALLVDISRRGEGSMVFTNSARELPAIFAQETSSVARATFLSDPSKLLSTAATSEFSRQAISWPETVSGYNLTYVRQEAHVAAYADDRYRAPLVALWQKGAGRAAAITFAAQQESGAIWPDYSQLVISLARWTSAQVKREGISFSYRQRGREVELYFASSTGADEGSANTPLGASLAQFMPRLILNYQDNNPQEVTWSEIVDGRWQAVVPLRPGEKLSGALRLGSLSMPFGPISGSSAGEWQSDQQAINQLEQIARSNGGRELLNLNEAWRNPGIFKRYDMRWLLLLLSLMLILAEVYINRFASRSRAVVKVPPLLKPPARATLAQLWRKAEKSQEKPEKAASAGEHDNKQTPKINLQENLRLQREQRFRQIRKKSDQV
ncbi:MAG: VWA domain-containing protein [bacterium]|nr:VWA domain-containing protein [bacterium]